MKSIGLMKLSPIPRKTLEFMHYSPLRNVNRGQNYLK